MTQEAEDGWYDGLRNSPNEILFGIWELAGMRPIGSTGLHAVNHRHGTATFGRGGPPWMSDLVRRPATEEAPAHCFGHW